jgi:hypothetical protein
MIDIVLVGLVITIFCGCVSADLKTQRNEHTPRFFVEAARGDLKSNKVVPIMLPVSGSEINILPVPSVPEFEIFSVEIKEGKEGPYLRFTLSPKARLNLMQLTGIYRGRRFVLVIGSTPIGSRLIDTVMIDGTISTYVEIPDSDLPLLVDKINDALKHAQ